MMINELLRKNEIRILEYKEPLIERRVVDEIVKSLESKIEESEKQIKKLKTTNKRFSTMIKNMKKKADR